MTRFEMYIDEIKGMWKEISEVIPESDRTLMVTTRAVAFNHGYRSDEQKFSSLNWLLEELPDGDAPDS